MRRRSTAERNVQWLLLGCLGVGKGTYASHISRLLGVPHITTGDLVRDELASWSPCCIGEVVLILVLFCFTVFAFVVTNRGAEESVSGRGWKEYLLGDYYSSRLQNRIQSTKNWDRIRNCLQDTKVCKSLQDMNQTFNQFMQSDLSPIEAFGEVLHLI